MTSITITKGTVETPIYLRMLNPFQLTFAKL